MTARTITASLALLLALPGLGAAQGLGDAAAREAQKRAKAPAKKEQPVPTLTNEDLERGRPAGSPGTPAASPAAEPSEGEGGGSGRGSRAADPAAQLRSYADAQQRARSRVEGLEARVAELGGRLNPMSTTFIYGANSGTGGNLQAEETRVRQALTLAEADLANAREALSRADQDLEDARRGRMPSRPPN